MGRRRKKKLDAAPVGPLTANQTAAPVVAAEAGALVDTNKMIEAIKVEPKFQDIFDKVVKAGLDLMFGANSEGGADTHQLMLEQLKKPDPMPKKLSEGIVSLVYILYGKSNKTLPPQILEGVSYVLLLRAFDFLQRAEDPEATREVLGEAAHLTSIGIHNALGVSEEQFNAAVQKGAQNG